MVARISTVAFYGIDVTTVDVQAQLSAGLPNFVVVGLPDKAIAESRERVRAAMHAMGLSLPAKRIIVNLAPADLVKEGSHYDLPIAIALLVSMGVLPEAEMGHYAALGEVGLDGSILPIAGVLPAAIHAQGLGRGLICPAANGTEAAWAGNQDVLAPASLLTLINHFKGVQVLSPPTAPMDASMQARFTGPDLSQVRGQHTARRALEVTAAGGHNMLMAGPPGAGKSLLAACLPGILPPLTAEEMLEVSMIHSIAGLLADGHLQQSRPFRDPHHSSSLAAMVGGGRRAAPGEITLAHRGVLFLDELPEFPPSILESLRQPLESGTVTVARANAHITYPARVQMIAAMNPCRCGYLGDPVRGCGKAPRCGADYQGRISGPLLDRIDIHLEMPEVEVLSMLNDTPGEPSATVADRVARARTRAAKRAEREGITARTNAELQGDILHHVAAPDAEGKALLETATTQLRLSMRGYTRVLRIARTIADLEGSEQVKKHHVAEALSYRPNPALRTVAEVA